MMTFLNYDAEVSTKTVKDFLRMNHDELSITLTGVKSQDQNLVLLKKTKKNPDCFRTFICKSCIQDALEGALSKRINAYVHVKPSALKDVCCSSMLQGIDNIDPTAEELPPKIALSMMMTFLNFNAQISVNSIMDAIELKFPAWTITITGSSDGADQHLVIKKPTAKNPDFFETYACENCILESIKKSLGNRIFDYVHIRPHANEHACCTSLLLGVDKDIKKFSGIPNAENIFDPNLYSK